MGKEMQQNGYIIQLYQYARQYRYNYEGNTDYFNYLIKTPNHGRPSLDQADAGEKEINNNSYIVFGDFDILEIIPVNTFRKYHDVSELAKKYLGRRQNVLLYCIKDDIPPRIQYDLTNKRLYGTEKNFAHKRFFCLSLLSITNEAHSSKVSVFTLLPRIRREILNIVDDLNRNQEESEKITCEVYGALNATEIGIVWLCNQYVDILMVIDYLKHMKLRLKGYSEDISLFLASNTTISTKLEEDLVDKDRMGGLEDVEGIASIQISVHDELKNQGDAKELIQKITDYTPEELEVSTSEDTESYSVLYSSGEYDIVIRMPASKALFKLQKNRILNNCEREDNGDYIKKLRKILRNNTKLLLEKRGKRIEELEQKLDGQEFILEISEIKEDYQENSLTKNSNWKEWMELVETKSGEVKSLLNGETAADSNYQYFTRIREKMSKMIRPSAGMIDMLDLIYADYLSTVASAYNQIWISDFHQQFKAVLHVMEQWLLHREKMQKPGNKDEVFDAQWKDFEDLTNAFKQQVYHLSQSSRMVLEIPHCHFRMTGQYDLLIHTYYGFAKIIIETIYLMQGRTHQSELIPLVTVNTVPKVRSEMYFEYGSHDDKRVINLNIPASIIFDPQRGLRYLVHELFHYAVPCQREKTNYLMGCFLISECLKMQFIQIFNQMLYMSINGTVDQNLKRYITDGADKFELSKLMRIVFFTRYEEIDDVLMPTDYWLDYEILNYVQQNADQWQEHSMINSVKEDINTEYQYLLFKFCGEEHSDPLFKGLCKYLLERAFENFKILSIKNQSDILQKTLKKVLSLENISQQDFWDKLFDRFQYCYTNKEYHELKFSERRADLADYKEIISKYIKLYNIVKEACSDIAMVSLTSMDFDDYLLFCIQVWRDSNCGEFNETKLDKEQWLRCGLVYEYFKNEKWFSELEQVKHNFVRKYLCFYMSRKNWNTVNSSELVNFETIRLQAHEWLICFKGQYSYYFAENEGPCILTYYDSVFVDIFSDFDVRKVSGQFGDSDRKNRLDQICNTIKRNVYDKYNELLDKHFTLNLIKGNGSDTSWKPQVIEDYRSGRFEHDLYVAQYFQKQKSLRELAACNLKIRNEQSQIPKWFLKKGGMIHTVADTEAIWEMHVRSLEELLFYLRHCEEKMKNGNIKEPIWFRGQPDKEYKLVPSVMRKYDTSKREKHRSLREYQQYEYEEFKYIADGAPEIPNGVRFTLSDYIALMQHYHVATHFLDWSENAFSALYFALEDYFEKKDTSKKEDADKNKNKDVSLYLLKPVKYNTLCRKKTIKKRKVFKADSDKTEGKIRTWMTENGPCTDKWIDNIIPNLSTRPNEKTFKSYLLGDTKFDSEFCDWSSSEDYDSGIEEDIGFYLPIAVRTSRLNTRIRMQSGCFVAFNLYTLPELSKQGEGKNNHAFDYISLEEVQRRMLEERDVLKGEKDNLFLYKITIDRCCCETVMEWLRGMGINRSSVYPELEQFKDRF